MYKFALFVALAVLATVSAQTPNEHDCRICEFILAIAKHHFHNNITNEADLKTQLLKECGNIANAADQTTCKAIVNNNIDKIFADLVAGDRDGQTCVDINYCTAAETGRPHYTGTGTFPTFQPKMVEKRERVRRQAPNEHDCRICEFILAIAKHHFHNNITNEADLKTQLLKECGNIANAADQTTCKAIVNNNIDKIYADLVAGDRDGQTCVDINYCTAAETGRPHYTGTGTFPTFQPKMAEKLQKRARRQAAATTENPRRECEQCDRLIGYAEYFFHRNPNVTQAQLQAELDNECKRRPGEEQECDTFVANNIATIYSDLVAGKRPFQTCEDLGACATRAPAVALVFDRH